MQFRRFSGLCGQIGLSYSARGRTAWTPCRNDDQIFCFRHKYITEEQAEWCHYIYIECGDCQRAVSRSCKNLLCVFDTTGAPVIVPVHDVEYLFSTTVDKSECRAILTKANFCELYKGWIDEHIRDPHACPLNDLYVSWEIPEPCAARIFLNR